MNVFIKYFYVIFLVYMLAEAREIFPITTTKKAVYYYNNLINFCDISLKKTKNLKKFKILKIFQHFF